MMLSRPPAKFWQTFTAIPTEGQDIRNPSPRLRILGVAFDADGTFVSVPSGSEDGRPVPLAVSAGQFWPLNFTKIDPATTALPLTVFWGPPR